MATYFGCDVLATTTGINGNAAGAAVELGYGYEDLFVQFDCSAVPTGGNPTLDVYLQTSADGGTTWRDIAHTQFTTSALKRFAQISGQTAGATSILAASDAALSGETVTQGAWGDRLRVKYVFAAGGSTGTYTLTVKAVPKGGVV